MSQVFNLRLLTNNQLDNTNVLESSFLEESYFISTLEFISETKKEAREYSKELYRNILESENTEVLNESFSDFFLKIKEIIDKFLKFIKSLFDRFSTMLHKMMGSDKYIIKNKDLFRKFTSDNTFDIDGYYYTFNPTIPVINALAEFTKDFVEIDFDILHGKKDNAEHLKYVKGVHSRLASSLQEGYYDKFRAEVIGIENYDISQADFGEELFEVFRNGTSKKDSITINQENLMSSLSFFENYKELEKEVKKTKEKIDKEYSVIEKTLKKLVYRDKEHDLGKAIGIGINPEYNGSNIDHINASQEVLNELNLFIKTKTNQIMEMSSIHAMAFSYKLDAIMECYKQDKKILYTALAEIQKNKK